MTSPVNGEETDLQVTNHSLSTLLHGSNGIAQIKAGSACLLGAVPPALGEDLAFYLQGQKPAWTTPQVHSCSSVCKSMAGTKAHGIKGLIPFAALVGLC